MGDRVWVRVSPTARNRSAGSPRGPHGGRTPSSRGSVTGEGRDCAGRVFLLPARLKARGSGGGVFALIRTCELVWAIGWMPMKLPREDSDRLSCLASNHGLCHSVLISKFINGDLHCVLCVVQL